MENTHKADQGSVTSLAELIRIAEYIRCNEPRIWTEAVRHATSCRPLDHSGKPEAVTKTLDLLSMEGGLE